MSRPSWLLTAALPLALLASTATARRPHTPHTLKLRFPRLSIPARTNPEACVLVRVATTAPFDLASIEIRHRGVRGSFAVQHFLVHLYTGEQLGEFAAERGRAVPSRGCLDLGPSDRDRRQLVASGTLTRSRSAFPPGVALRLSPVPDTPGGPPAGLGFTLDGEWTNGTPHTRSASALVVLRRARPKKVTRIALPFADRSAEAGLLVAPEEVASMNATTTTVPITLTTGLAAAPGMVVEGMPIASDGRFALVGITAESGLGPPLGGQLLAVRLACQAAPRPDTDQFHFATRTTPVSATLTARALRLRAIFAPGATDAPDFPGSPALLRASNGDTTIAAVDLPSGLPARGRRLFIGSDDGRAALGARRLQRPGPAAYLFAVKVKSPTLPAVTGGPVSVTLTYDVGGLLSRLTLPMRVKRPGALLRYP